MSDGHSPALAPRLTLDTRAVEFLIGAVLIVGGTVALLALRFSVDADPTTGEDLVNGSLVILVAVAFLFVVANVVALRVRFDETKLVRERYWWPFKTTTVVDYRSITRVRAAEHLGVTVDLDDGRTYKLADTFMTSVHGSLPDVEFKAGAHSVPMLRMRRIARFIELAAENERAAPG